MPPTVRDVVGARLARLSPAAREAVQAAAVIGTRVDRPLLAAVCAGPGAAVDECLASGILVPTGPDCGSGTSSSGWRLAAIAPHRKIELHARLLAELSAGDADPAVLAHHAAGAGDDQAVRGTRPRRPGARRGWARTARRRRTWSGPCGSPNRRPAALAGLHESLAHEYALLDRWPQAEQALRAALALRRDSATAGRRQGPAACCPRTLWRLCRARESARAADEAVRVLEVLPPGPELAWAYVGVAVSRWGCRPRDEASPAWARRGTSVAGWQAGVVSCG